MNQILEILHFASTKTDFCVLSGDDLLTLPMMAAGAQGVVSVLSNLMPKKISQMVQTIEKGDFKEAQKQFHTLFPFFQMSSLETNPVPIKMMMRLCHYPAGECRLPLCEMSEKHQKEIKSFIQERWSFIRETL